MAKLLKVDPEAADYADKMQVRGLWILDQFLFDTNRNNVCERAYAGLAKVIAIEYLLADYGVSFLDFGSNGGFSSTGAIERIKVGSTEVSYGAAEKSGSAKAQTDTIYGLMVEAKNLYMKLVHGCRKLPRPKAGDFKHGHYQL